jgi:hypothetical protein
MKILTVARPFFIAACALSALVGCGTSPDEETPATEDELKSRDCPPSIEVLLRKPSIKSDAQLVSSWKRDMESYERDPQAAAEEQLTRLASHVAKARTQTAVKLRGTIGRACSYKTVDAETGEPNDYRIWFAKTGGRNGELQVRIERQLEEADDVLFFKAPLSSLSTTSVSVASGKSATAVAFETPAANGPSTRPATPKVESASPFAP